MKKLMSNLFCTLVILTLLVSAMPIGANMYTVNASPSTVEDSLGDASPQPMPEQKVSPELLEMLEELGLDGEDPVRIIIKHSPSAEIQLPKDIEVLRTFDLVPMISAVAPYSAIEELASLPGVEGVYPDLKKYISREEYPALPYPNYTDIQNWRDAELITEQVPYTPWIGDYPAFLNETTELIGARDLWAQGITGEGVIIAILDTGINSHHPDLDDMDDDPTTHDPKVLADVSFVPGEGPWDVQGHGTHVAGTAAGTGATGGMGFYATWAYSGYYLGTILPGTGRGVAPGAHLYNVKIFDSEGSAYDSWIIAGIEWSVENGADVISASWGGWPAVPPDQDPVVLALRAAIEHGVVVVVAAGNEGFGYFTVASPAFAPDVITVGATTETDHLIFFSSRGPEEYELHAKPDVVAPGVAVVAPFAFFEMFEEYYGMQMFYLEISGTSMSTPHVSGAAALLLSAFPGATPHTIKSALMLGAEDLGLDPMAQGAGRIDIAAAYGVMSQAPTVDWTAPVPTNTVVPSPPTMIEALNLTSKDILVESRFSSYEEFGSFLWLLEVFGAHLTYNLSPYDNATLVNQTSGEPFYDVFIIPEPYYPYFDLLPPSVLAHYVEHGGTVLFIGDWPCLTGYYNQWTEPFDITWNNTAVGGLSTNIAPHAITSGIAEVYFGNPISSLIIGADAQCVVWDPILPGVAVWEAPGQGKVVVVSDDAVLNDQFLYAADNMRLGLNIIKWFTGASVIYLTQEEGLVPISPPIESPHPYYDDMWQEYTVSHPGASWISVHFDTIDVEDNFDYIIIFDENWNLVTSYTGYYYDIWTPPVPGDLVRIILSTDGSVTYWGFLVDYYYYGILAPAPTEYHEIGVGGTWEKYVVANSSATITVNVTNFGTFTEDIELYMYVWNSTGDLVVFDWNFANVTGLEPGETEIVDASCLITLNATLLCDFAGLSTYTFVIQGYIPYMELDYGNNGFMFEVGAVPKTERSGANPVLSVVTPMKIESTSVPLITMYSEDFTLHTVTAFVGGGELVDAEFEITGDVSEIADFVNVTAFTYHTTLPTQWGWLNDPSPAYFLPTTTAIIGDTLVIGDTSAPTMLFAPLQVYIAEDTALGVYTGTINLLNGTEVIASASLSFEVREAEASILWEDYYDAYTYYWFDCERLWGGAAFGYGVFEWWKLAAEAGFDVDSLHQQVYFGQHLGSLSWIGYPSEDPMDIIAYGGYDCLYMHDPDFNFRDYEVSVLRQLYENGEMSFVILPDGGSTEIESFTWWYGIRLRDFIEDLVVTSFEEEHPIFDDVENFTLFMGPVLEVYRYPRHYTTFPQHISTGIAAGTDDWGLDYPSGFTAVVSEGLYQEHWLTRMAVLSDSSMFEFLEYMGFIVWSVTGEVISRTDTDRVAVNLLKWVVPDFLNTAPLIESASISATEVYPDETILVDAVVSDPENDPLTVTVAVKKPDNTWENIIASYEAGHWTAEFTADLEGAYNVYVTATDEYDTSATWLGGTLKAINLPPEIVSASVSPTKVKRGDPVFITAKVKDLEDLEPALCNVTITDPTGAVHTYTFTDVAFANVEFDTAGMPGGVYEITVTVKDSLGATTSEDVGFFEVEMPSFIERLLLLLPVPVSYKTLILGIGGLGLLLLLIAVALLARRGGRREEVVIE